MTKNLAGKVALITGSSRGIGAASAASFLTGTVLKVDGGFGGLTRTTETTSGA